MPHRRNHYIFFSAYRLSSLYRHHRFGGSISSEYYWNLLKNFDSLSFDIRPVNRLFFIKKTKLGDFEEDSSEAARGQLVTVRPASLNEKNANKKQKSRKEKKIKTKKKKGEPKRHRLPGGSLTTRAPPSESRVAFLFIFSFFRPKRFTPFFISSSRLAASE